MKRRDAFVLVVVVVIDGVVEPDTGGVCVPGVVVSRKKCQYAYY